ASINRNDKRPTFSAHRSLARKVSLLRVPNNRSIIVSLPISGVGDRRSGDSLTTAAGWSGGLTDSSGVLRRPPSKYTASALITNTPAKTTMSVRISRRFSEFFFIGSTKAQRLLLIRSLGRR